MKTGNRRGKRPRAQRAEEAIQRSCLKLFQWALPEDVFVFHVPNGGARHAVEGAIFKALGVIAGVPDLCFIHAGRFYAIELKAPGNSLSESQKTTIPRMERAGATVAVATSADEVVQTLHGWGIPLTLSDAGLRAYGVQKRAA